MNKLIVFMLGSCSTFSIHLGLMYVNWWDMLFTHAMSLVGGVKMSAMRTIEKGVNRTIGSGKIV